VQYARMPEHKKGTLGEATPRRSPSNPEGAAGLRRVVSGGRRGTNWEVLAEVERAGGGNPWRACRLWISTMRVSTSKEAVTPSGARARPGTLRVCSPPRPAQRAEDGAERIIQTFNYHRGGPVVPAVSGLVPP